MKDMIKNTYDYTCDLCDRASDIFEMINNKKNIKNYDDTSVSIICPSNKVNDVLYDLMDEYDLGCVTYKDIYDYDGDYVLTISSIEGCGQIWCEPMMRDNGYLDIYDFATYVFDECNKEVLSHINSNITILAHVLRNDCEILSDLQESFNFL